MPGRLANHGKVPGQCSGTGFRGNVPGQGSGRFGGRFQAGFQRGWGQVPGRVWTMFWAVSGQFGRFLFREIQVSDKVSTS